MADKKSDRQGNETEAKQQRELSSEKLAKEELSAKELENVSGGCDEGDS